MMILLNAFFNNEKIEANLNLACINASPSNNGSGNILFTGKKSDFDDITDFKSYLKNIILDNDLAIYGIPKGNFIVKYLNNKILESEPKRYDLDKLLDNHADVSIFKDNETVDNEFKIDAGYGARHLVKDDTFIFLIAENKKNVQDYCKGITLNKTNSLVKKNKVF
jgi:hypothetical protein